MAKNLPNTDVACPQCQTDGPHIWRMDIHSATNVTVLNCVTCDWEWSKDQSVKISGALVRFAAEAMYKHEGYSGLGEFVRDAVRRRCDEIFSNPWMSNKGRGSEEENSN